MKGLKMKLRNKKTGEIKSITEIIREAFLSSELDALKNIADNWEDIDATNATNIPLIKDKRIREAVRAWAKANDIETVSFYTCSHFWYLRSYRREQGIDFWLKWDDKPELVETQEYTITELCGKEEQ